MNQRVILQGIIGPNESFSTSFISIDYAIPMLDLFTGAGYVIRPTVYQGTTPLNGTDSLAAIAAWREAHPAT